MIKFLNYSKFTKLNKQYYIKVQANYSKLLSMKSEKSQVFLWMKEFPLITTIEEQVETDKRYGGPLDAFTLDVPFSQIG